MSDATKILSQCGVLVTTQQIVTTQVNPDYMNLDSGAMFDRYFLFDTDEDDTTIDIYFIKTIDLDPNQGCGLTSGVTASPTNSGILYEAGIAIPDSVCDGANTGQEIVRTVAHEIAHYLLNHHDGEDDHTGDDANLMYFGGSASKRDLDAAQCLELRANYGVD